ncbi:hypothetical protein DL990_20100 [Amycolatopsis sp. WAC 01416]|uniref:hypothetical protein n=1 Tax=Amycolatopsis sp. WAC 01416 TaxID=2203196 RepID=UPI000F7B1E0F|nr:hypothetical protein [Amycolatopsis sp. WAC 01416]RSN32223.1 hypothetical protein DL990_20100 [Amycolatopsis sp. WAC 01416]
MSFFSAVKATAKAVDKTAEFVGKNRSQVVAHTGNGLPESHCGGCGKRAKRQFNGYGHCGKWACQQKITAKVYG